MVEVGGTDDFDATAHIDVPEKTEDQVYAHRVAKRVDHSSAAGEAQELASRCQLWGTDVETHIIDVFAAGGIDDLAARKKQVEAAAKRQQQLIAERKSRKKEKLRETARAAGGLLHEAVEAADKPNILDAAKKLVQAHDGADSGTGSGLTWAELEGFKTREEALQFVMECQPFDYMPESIVSRGDVLPRFENCREAHAFVKGLMPPPSEFLSTTKDFKRRLRIRRVDPEQTAEEAEKRLVPTHRPAAGGLRGRRGSFLRSAATHLPTAKPPPSARRKEHKEWRVEASGQLFERPTKLREDAVAGARYYVAVASSVERRVLSEGFRVTRRTSIPCSATPQDAVRAFEGDEKPRAGGATGLSTFRPSVSVLAVQVPAGVDVVPHRKGGFVIRTQELPASCFRRQRTAGVAP